MIVRLRPVPGFGTFPDGRLRAGPFIAESRGLSAEMARQRIFPGHECGTGHVSIIPDGLMLSASGTGVTGYFVDRDGIEASRSDLDRFILATVAAGTLFRVSGHYCPDRDVMISSEAVARHDGRHVTWQVMRRLRGRDGRERVIMASRPEMAAGLALAC